MRTRVGQNCEFCGSPALVDYDEIKSPIRPRGPAAVPASIATASATTFAAGGAASGWRQAAGKRGAGRYAFTSLYIPYWTFDAHAHCPWEAEAGHYYYVNVDGRDSKGRPTVDQERRVRWEPASGVVDHSSTMSRCPGRRGCRSICCAQVEPFPTRELVPYDTAFLSGLVVEHYQVVLTEAASSRSSR